MGETSSEKVKKKTLNFESNTGKQNENHILKQSIEEKELVIIIVLAFRFPLQNLTGTRIDSP